MQSFKKFFDNPMEKERRLEYRVGIIKTLTATLKDLDLWGADADDELRHNLWALLFKMVLDANLLYSEIRN